MKKYKLIVVGGESRLTGEYDNVVKGFAAAEERAKKLLREHLPNYPDTYIACFEKGETMYNWDYLIYTKDYFGDVYWKMMVVGDFGPLYDRLLEEDEEDELDRLRNEVEHDISDLNEEELKELRTEIRIGSVYLSDYENSFNVDESKLCDICDSYDSYLCEDEDDNPLPESEWKQDTPEEFAYFCMNYL